MKGQLKWADVAHMYQNSGITIQSMKYPKFRCKLTNVKGFYIYGTDGGLGDVIWHFDQAQPILRHLEDITEVEAAALYESEWGFPYEYSGSVYHSAKDWFASKKEYSPELLHKIFQMGLDPYRLIESGEAIRKEASK